MKRFYFSLLVLLTFGMTAFALPFKAGVKYRIVCDHYNTGALTLGQYHGSTALVYYDVTATTATADAWWEFAETSDGAFTIRNAQSGQYLYYEGTREDGVAKGIRLTTTPTATEAQWTLHSTGQSFAFVNKANTGEYINVRTDGSYLVGTYTEKSSLTANELFKIYDETGAEVLDEEEQPSGPVVVEGESGVTEGGAYWELMGIETPVVVSTASDPVLYRIRNVRSGKYIYHSGYQLFQSDSEADGTLFYFTDAGGGRYNIYTSTGYYVSTYCSTSGWGSSSTNSVEVYSGTVFSGMDIWTLSFSTTDYPGYAIERQADRESGNKAKNFWNDYNQSTIGYYTLDGGSTFCFSSSDPRHLDNLLEQGVSIEGYTAQQTFRTLVDSVRFDQKDLVYRQDTKSYLFNIRPRYRDGREYQPQVAVRFAEPEKGYRLCLNGQELSADGTFTLSEITGLKDYELQVWGADTIAATARLNFTFLPIVEVNVPSCNSRTYTEGSIRVNFFQAAGYDSTYIAAFKYRGASAQNYQKKSYAVKLRDKDGNSVDREFLGYRSDNNWILDAMAVDKGCMRNRVSTDLWNDFSHEPYHQADEPKARTGTRGRFVEVLLNGRYHGIYCMTEKVDRKQLKLKKYTPKGGSVPADTIHGTLYKSSQWGYEVFFGHDTDNLSYVFPNHEASAYNNLNKQETWCNYEIKYPDYEDEPIDWKPLYDAINFVATSDDYTFASYVTSYFDYPVLIDYYLFIELLLATDNHGKNMFYFNYDQRAKKNARKLGIAPWDLDGVFGLRWDGSSNITYANQDFPSFLDAHEHGQLSYFYRLQRDKWLGWEQSLKDRYAELRRTFFKPEALCERFSEYMEIFEMSGADLREQDRWAQYHPNISSNISYTYTWIQQRIAQLDEQYGYDPENDPYVGISNVTDSKYIGATGGKGFISIHAPQAKTVRVYTAGGQLVRTAKVPAGVSRLTGFDAGIYIADGVKVIVL